MTDKKLFAQMNVRIRNLKGQVLELEAKDQLIKVLEDSNVLLQSRFDLLQQTVCTKIQKINKMQVRINRLDEQVEFYRPK